jgi:hypothetical protein
VSTSGSTSPKLPRPRPARGVREGGATLPVAVARRRGWAGRFAPLPGVGRALPGVGRALRGAAVPGRAAALGRAADRAAALRGAAVRRFADGDAGFRAADAADPLCADRADDGLADEGFATDLPEVVPRFAAPVEPLAAELFGVEPFPAALFRTDPDGLFDAPLPFDGVVPLPFEDEPPFEAAPFEAEEPAPDPARGVEPEPRAGPEGRAGRREEGMGRFCRFAGPLYRHYLRRAVCRTCGTRRLSDTNGRVRRTGHRSDPYV